ncbi:MAG: radical SAM protein [Candidatus Omnitrophota bacterium]
MPGKQTSEKTEQYPSYLDAFQNGTLERISGLAFKLLESCAICPRKCKVNRLKGQTGFCKTGLEPVVYSSLPHHGEEPPISGKRGSGTIFFSGCNMACVYCQNYEFSQAIDGKPASDEELANLMLKLQDSGCHNINLVTPTHVMPQILKALLLAIPKGLRIPLVYNTGGFELPAIIRLLDGIVDIYLADMRYADSRMAIKYSFAADYARFNRESIAEMHRQTGIAEFGENGIIKKGLIVRLLVMPENISGTEETIKFIAENISKDTYISLMSQYTPFYKASGIKELSRRISREAYSSAQAAMEKYGLYNGWTQDSGGLDRFAGVNIKNAFSE